MGLFDFYFQAAFQTAKRKRIVTLVIIHPQTMKTILVAMKMVMMTVSVTMIVLTMTITIVVIAIVMNMKASRMMSAMTIIAVGSYLQKMDFHIIILKVMKKIAILLAATIAFAINSDAQSMQSGYKGHVEAGYSVGIGDYDFGRFEVNTTHGYQVNPYIFLGAGTGLHFMSSYKTGDMEIPLDVRDSKVDIPVFANFRSNFTKGKISPFFDIKGGTFVTNNGGLYVVASLGVRYALNNKQGLSLSVGYAAEKLEFETFERFNGRYDMSYTRKPATYDTESVSVKLGFDF